MEKEKNQPANVEVVMEKAGDLSESVMAALKSAVLEGSLSQMTGELPVCLVIDKKGDILFVSQGYNIGTGDRMLEIMMNDK